MVKIDSSLFKSPKEMEQFLGILENTLKEAGGNPVPICYEDKVIVYMIPVNSLLNRSENEA